MKKTLLNVVSLMLLIVGIVNAQDATSFSILVGPNYAWGNGNKSFFESTAKFGYCLGGSLQTKLQDKLGFELQMVYSYNQAKYTFTDNEPDYNYYSKFTGTQEISFVDMPILITYHTGNSLLNRLKVGFVASWAISAHTNSEYHEDDDGYTFDYSYSRDNEDFFKTSDIAITAGTEIRLSEGLGLDVRYLHGLRGILDQSGDFKVKRSVISVMLTKKL